jgi:hypothetical protein
MECTKMDEADRREYDKVFGKGTYELGSEHWSPCTRPRWRWPSEEPQWPKAVTTRTGPDGIVKVTPGVDRMKTEEFVTPGWRPCGGKDY